MTANTTDQQRIAEMPEPEFYVWMDAFNIQRMGRKAPEHVHARPYFSQRQMRAALTAQDAQERTFWVVEQFINGVGGQYWDGHCVNFTKDIEKAIQFCRREDAFWATRGRQWGDARITEHVIMSTAQPADSKQPEQSAKFNLGDRVKKVSGSQWHGKIVGTYSTALTPEGYAVESATEEGSVQIYPAKALEPWDGNVRPQLSDEDILALANNTWPIEASFEAGSEYEVTKAGAIQFARSLLSLQSGDKTGEVV